MGNMDSQIEFLETPQKKETLQQIAEARNHKRFLLGTVKNLPAEKWVDLGEIFFLISLFFLNLWLIWPFFGLKGITTVFSAPLIPFLSILSSFIIPYPSGLKIWLLIFILFFPLTFYFFLKEISQRKLIASAGSLFVSLPVGIFLPLRLEFGILKGDGPHIASLTLSALICLLLLRFLRKGDFKLGVLTGAGIALIALTSPLGLVIFFSFALLITFSEMLLGQGRIKFLRFAFVFFLAAGFSAFWYNPKFVIITVNSSSGKLVRQALANLFPISFFLVPFLGTFGFLLFENRPHLQSFFLALFWTAGFGLLSWGSAIPLAEPSRFLPALGISLAFLAGIAISFFYDFLRNWIKLKNFKISSLKKIDIGFYGLFFGLIIFLIFLFQENLWQLRQSEVLGASSTAQVEVGVWEIREDTSFVEKFFGYVISAGTLISLIPLHKKLNKHSG